MVNGPQFLHDSFSGLNSGAEIGLVVNYLRNNGEKIPENPSERIDAYLGFLATVVGDGIFTGDKEHIERQIDENTIESSQFTESFFESQRKMAIHQGRGELILDEFGKRELIVRHQTEQRQSLQRWARYLSKNDAKFPDWFIFYAWTAVKGLGKYDDKDTQNPKFLKRNKSTVAPFPDLNPEALSSVYSLIVKHSEEGYDKNLSKSIRATSFGNIYARALYDKTKNKEAYVSNEGSWQLYSVTNYSSEAEKTIEAKRLAGSLEGFNTGWCTAIEETAASQLEMGDFYVFFSKNSEGEEVIPRIAIRLENGVVNEVRGIEGNQEMEDDMLDTVLEKLRILPGGNTYFKRVSDMKSITDVCKRLAEDSDTELTLEELKLIYETDGMTVGFGQDNESDPRVEVLRGQRKDVISDLKLVYGTDDPVKIANELCDRFQGSIVASNLDFFEFSKLDKTCRAYLLDYNARQLVANYPKLRDPSLDLAMISKNIDLIDLIILIKGLPDGCIEGFEAEDVIDMLGMQEFLSCLSKFKPGSIDHELFEYYSERLKEAIAGEDPSISKHFKNPKAVLAIIGTSNTSDGEVNKEVDLLRLCENGQSAVVIDNLLVNPNYYGTRGINEYLLSVASTRAGSLALARNLDQFSGLDERIARQLIENFKGAAVKKNINSFTDLSEYTMDRLSTY